MTLVEQAICAFALFFVAGGRTNKFSLWKVSFLFITVVKPPLAGGGGEVKLILVF